MTEAAMPPAVIAEAVAAAKEMLRLTHESEDALLARLAATAFALAEAFCGVALVTREFVETVEGDGSWARLARAPVAAVTRVEGAGGVLSVSAYAVDIDGDGDGWVRAAERVTVTYRAGASAGFAVLPAGVAHGVVLLAVHLFENRQGEVAPPAAVAALWRPFRRLRLDVGLHRERHA
ncbi:hypothetical protein KCP91_10355 [Microvirga sp. SRT01]|uniref:PhiE125 gp8 family phage protein n=1 Tax=Sphingomonas longa TaxID=2778730 RepID=A0ABS2D772_9SPHN|nr:MULTISPECIES: hypothetical protein [Alphaproteobacteria]MBM6576777.1 hypothetical protein [Sphingomonas sp. BT552]MBR7709822.1 hypothetical protein [Microvirga sp. SRT01]